MRAIEVIIDELVLQGVEPARRHAVGDAVRAALAARLAAEPGAFARVIPAADATVRGSSVMDAPDAFGGAIADAVAGAIRAALRQEATP